MPIRLALLVAFSLLCAGAHAQLRQETSLSGDWEYVRVKELTSPPATGWQAIKVPGTLNGYDYERAWFRRDFTIPETMRGPGLRLVLHFGGVKYNSTVLVNGKQVGGHFGGYDPFDVDITAVAKVGAANHIGLGCYDWTGVFADKNTDFSAYKNQPVEIREIPRDEALAPIGGMVTAYGPWDDVKLRAIPEVRVKDLFIKPSVRKQALRVEYRLENLTDRDAQATLQASALDQDAPKLALPPQTVTIPAGKQAAAVLEAPWTDARLWSPEDPHLYVLQTTLKSGEAVLDQLPTRFGFREFWVDGCKFFLNGSRINLLATSWWPELGVTKEHIQDRMTRIKAAGCVSFRTHTQAWPEIWYETADEMGLMMIPEGAVWNDRDTYRINDPRFWENYQAQLKAEVDRDKNKPSVIMYSLENEFYGGRLNNAAPAAKNLAHLAELMHQWDPTRPVYYESDGDPGGLADVIGMHYPHEYPEFTTWPNTAYWMDTPLIDRFFAKDAATAHSWVWDRKKPVYIGEFLWIPSADPSWDTVFFGDDTYTDYTGYHAKAKGESWKMAIQAYRYYEVGGISPWTMVEGGALDEQTNAMYAGQKYAMQHIAAYLREYDHSFFSGDEVTRTADVYNDVLSASNLVFQWALLDGDKQLHQGEKTLVMDPGQRQELSFTETMPLVQARRDLSLRIRIVCGGEQVFEDTKAYSVFPLPTLKAPEGIEIGLYDPTGATAGALAKHGLQPTTVDDLASIPATVKVLIIGAGALKGAVASEPVIGAADAGRHGLMDFVQAGGRALVLEQSEYPRGLAPVTLTRHDSTMTFPQMPNHPLLAGLKPGDLKWWRPDNFVSASEPVRPAAGASEAVVVSGSAQGIAHAPLLELPRGKGTLVVSQMRLAERLGVEPAAGILLQNALDYLAGFKPHTAKTALYCPDPHTREYLGGIRLACTDITANPAKADWDAIDLLIICGSPDGLAGFSTRIQALLQRGGTVLLHGVAPSNSPALRALLGAGVTLIPYKGPATRIPAAHPLSEFLTNEDLYWLGKSNAAISWATRPLADDMTSAVIGKTLEGKQTTEYSHEVMTVTGTYAANGAETASLPSGGSTATAEIEVPADGSYILGVVAGGSQAYGVWPAGAVKVDGKLFGSFACQKGELDTYTMFGNLTAGKHKVAVEFTNDAYNPPNEDRNLVVKSILVAQDDKTADVAFLTSPPAVAVIQQGPGRVILDNINWDTAERETRKASRYLCGLLTGLGAQFQDATATVIEAVTFAHDPNMHWYNTEGGVAYMGDSGYIVGKVKCAKAGRYVMNVVAGGTPVKKVYPIIAVEIDGKPAGTIELKSESWRAYPLTVDLAEGVRELKLIFTNDEWSPPEDRNLKIESLEFSAAR